MIERLQRLHYDFVNDSRGGAPAVLVMSPDDVHKLDSELDRLMLKPLSPDTVRLAHGKGRVFLGARIVQRVTYAPPFFALHA